MRSIKTIVLPSVKKLLDRVYVVIPALNEEKRIGSLVAQLEDKGFTNIIVVNDGSDDDTPQLFEYNPNVTVINHLINLGPGASTMTGIEHAVKQKAEYIATIDADLQHHPEDLVKIVAEIHQKDLDLVIGSRFLTENTIPTIRIMYNMVGNWISWMKTGLRVSDSQSGLKVMSLNFAQKLAIDYNGFEFCIDIIKKAKLQKVNVGESAVGVTYTKETLEKGQSFSNGLMMLGRLMNPFS